MSEKKRKIFSGQFKAKVALEAIPERLVYIRILQRMGWLID